MPSALLAIVLACFAFVGDVPTLAPGQRLEGVERARVVIVEAGSYTLGRSGGALVFDGQRSDSGWLVVELRPGAHEVELPGGPGDVTLLSGKIEDAGCGTFLNTAIAYLNANELNAAYRTFMAAQARPGEAAHHALARLFLGIVLQREDRDLDQARALIEGAREAAKPFGADVEAYGENSLGQIGLSLEDWDLAQRSFERVRELSSDADVKLVALSGLAQAAGGRGDFEAAHRLHEEALEAVRAAAVSPSRSSICFEAGKWYQSRGEFDRAAELLGQAASSAPTWLEKVGALGQLGLVELVRGNYGRARGMLDEAKAIATPHLPSPHDEELLAAHAALAFGLGDYGAASESLDRLYAVMKSDEQRLQQLPNLALVARLKDEPERADRLFGEALAKATGATRFLALHGRAGLLFEEGRAAEAAPLAHEALRLAEELDDPLAQIQGQLVVSEASRRLGDAKDAREKAESALAAAEALGTREYVLPAMHSIAAAALAQGEEGTVEAMLDRAWEESRRDEISELDSLQAAQVRSLLGRLAEWSEVAVDLAALRSARDAGQLAQDLQRVAGWKSLTLLDSLGERVDPHSDLVSALAPVLPDRALVEYAAGEQHLYAFVLQGKDLRLVDLGERRPIEDLVQAFTAGLSDRKHLASAADVARLGRQLHDRLLEPLDIARKGVVIVPGGGLARLPFEALVVYAPDDVTRFDQITFVLDDLDVGYAPSSAALAALAHRPAGPSRTGTALLIGDPVYVHEGPPELVAMRSSVAQRWHRLPQTRDELTGVARLLLARRSDETVREDAHALSLADTKRDVSLSTPTFELRLGREASVEALKRLAPAAQLIHVAAHAMVDRWNVRRTGLVLSWDEDYEGLFSLEDITRLELDADLVILSACDTADGRLLGGEGVQSLAGAFLAAGARSVVATLWPVEDTAAEFLMGSFAAARLNGGLPPDRALREAKRALRRGSGEPGRSVDQSRAPDRAVGHPYYWASYLFSGASETIGSVTR